MLDTIEAAGWTLSIPCWVLITGFSSLLNRCVVFLSMEGNCLPGRTENENCNCFWISTCISISLFTHIYMYTHTLNTESFANFIRVWEVGTLWNCFTMHQNFINNNDNKVFYVVKAQLMQLQFLLEFINILKNFDKWKSYRQIKTGLKGKY